MKIKMLLLAGVAAVFCNVTEAQSCQDLFDAANTQEKEASKLANKASDQFAGLHHLEGANAPDGPLCAMGQTTRIDAFTSAQKLKASRSIWLRAAQTCPAQNQQEAALQAENKTTRYNMQANFVAEMDSWLGPKCNFPPMAPLLNQ